MGFSLNTRRIGDVVVVDMAGRLTEGEPASLVRDTVRRFIAKGERKFVLNLGDVSFINSGGLTAFTAIRSWMDEYGGKASLVHLTRRVEQVLQITHLVTVFDTFVDEEEAVGSLRGSGVPG